MIPKLYRPTRVWINQPSTLQEHYSLHGKVGIAMREEGDTDIVTIYFCDGPIHSQRIKRSILVESK